jgi:hypothetical protein
MIAICVVYHTMANREDTRVVAARVPRVLAERVRVEAEKLGVPISALVEHLIESALGVGK